MMTKEKTRSKGACRVLAVQLWMQAGGQIDPMIYFVSQPWQLWCSSDAVPNVYPFILVRDRFIFRNHRVTGKVGILGSPNISCNLKNWVHL